MTDAGQLDLWGGGGGGGLRWIASEQPGRLGIAPFDIDLAKLRAEHRVSVVVAVIADPAAVVERAADEAIDVRHLRTTDGIIAPSTLGLHAIALAADARAGRRVVVLGDDATAGLVVAAALVELGASVDDAVKTVGGDVSEAGREALGRFAG